MKQPTFNGRVLLPMSVIEAARAGDPLAVERVLRYYDRYINKLCTRTLYEEDGMPHMHVDILPLINDLIDHFLKKSDEII